MPWPPDGADELRPGMNEGRPARRRRYVAPPRNLGPSSDAIFATPSTASPAVPLQDTARTPGPHATRGGSRDVLPDRAAKDTDAAWGERGGDENDARLRRDRPPHWE